MMPPLVVRYAPTGFVAFGPASGAATLCWLAKMAGHGWDLDDFELIPAALREAGEPVYRGYRSAPGSPVRAESAEDSYGRSDH